MEKKKGVLENTEALRRDAQGAIGAWSALFPYHLFLVNQAQSLNAANFLLNPLQEAQKIKNPQIFPTFFILDFIELYPDAVWVGLTQSLTEMIRLMAIPRLWNDATYVNFRNTFDPTLLPLLQISADAEHNYGLWIAIEAEHQKRKAKKVKLHDKITTFLQNVSFVPNSKKSQDQSVLEPHE